MRTLNEEAPMDCSHFPVVVSYPTDRVDNSSVLSSAMKREDMLVTVVSSIRLNLAISTY